jgi:DNA-binding NarL/FixJ family response regulator
VQQVLRKGGELRYSKHPVPTKKEDAMIAKYHQLTHEEQYSITALLRTGHSQAEIAAELGRAKSTISRELRRNAIPSLAVTRCGG